jgi:acyl-CoA thioesterase
VDFAAITTPARLDTERFQAEIPDGWQQGRGAFGGVVLGNLARALQAFDAAPERSLRSLTAEICGPVLQGPALIVVERLRTGTGVSTLAARLSQGGEVLAHAVGVLGKDRSDDTDFCDLPAPAMPPWRDVPAIPLSPPFAPVFTQHMEYRVTSGPPYQGSGEPVAHGWVRPKDPGPTRDAAYLAALVDAYWPAVASRLPGPRPIATVAFTLEVLGSLDGLDPDAPLYHHGRTLAGRGGYLAETRTLRGEDGRLLAINHQTLAVIK